MTSQTHLMAATLAVSFAATAIADYTITISDVATSYSDFSLNFDEPGGPVGPVPADFWLDSLGLTLDSGVGGGGGVADFDADVGFDLGDGNAWNGPFGAFMTFETDVTAMSLQVWDPSGPGGPFGGGQAVILFNDGVEVGSLFADAAWGGIGDTWVDISTSDGMVFDEVRILGFGLIPSTYIDNMSWNVVPGPATLALFGAAGLRRRRRRA